MPILRSSHSPLSAVVAIAALLSALAILSSSGSAELATIKCDAPISTVVKQQFNDPFVTSSARFVDVPGARTRVTVPAGETRCVMVQFFASASCVAPFSGAECFVRAVDEDHPGSFAPAVTLLSDQRTPASHAFAFATRLGVGSHTIQIQIATENGAKADLADWQASFGTGP
jgi:hypothetical protein